MSAFPKDDGNNINPNPDPKTRPCKSSIAWEAMLEKMYKSYLWDITLDTRSYPNPLPVR